MQGSRLALTCLAILGDIPLTFHWNKNGIDFRNDNDHVHVENSHSMSTLFFENLSINDSGNYSCLVENQFGFDRQNTYLSVQGVAEKIFKRFQFLSKIIINLI